MKTLTISDLSSSKELDAKAMAGVTGGHSLAKMHRRYNPRRWARRPRNVVKNVQTNNVDFGSSNNILGITTGVNNGSVTVNGGLRF